MIHRAMQLMILLSLILALAACSTTAPPSPTATPTPTWTAGPPTPTPIPAIKLHNIDYTSMFQLDVYAPTDPGPWPVAVLFHGGGLTKDSLGGLASLVAERGVVVFAPTYRADEPAPDSQIVAGWEDAACAVRFARAHAAEYRGDPARVIAAGHSAGGAAGAVMALAGDGFRGDCLAAEGSALVDGFVGLDGAYDIPAYVGDALRGDPAVEAEVARMSPYSYLDRAPVRAGVEFRLWAGVEDELWDDALRLRDALRETGYTATAQRLPGIDHLSMSSASRWEIVADIAALAWEEYRRP